MRYDIVDDAMVRRGKRIKMEKGGKRERVERGKGWERGNGGKGGMVVREERWKGMTEGEKWVMKG